MNNLDYGVVGNCKTAALISKEGSIDWLCFPVFDSPSVFSKLLDKNKGGSFSIKVGESYQITQSYFKETNILSTRFSSEEGVFEVLDFMPRYRSFGEYYIPSEIYRYFKLISGEPRFRIIYDPVMNYGKEVVVNRIFPDYIRTFSMDDGDHNMYLYSSFSFENILDQSEIVLNKDEFLLLSYNQKLATIDINQVYLEYQRTKVYWLNWNNRSRKFNQYNEIISRSLLVLKMMSFEHSGAIIAALTTSIPETIGEVRNWDYRFCWIRDASMSIDTLIKLGHRSTARKFMGFIKRILRSKTDSLQIMYGIDGTRTLKEEILPHLAGYENSQPVRIGNAAYFQRQNDSYGYLMDVINSYYFRFSGTLGEMEEMWEIVRAIVKKVYISWRQPDQSIWEFRNREKHFVSSKIMCWVALNKAIEIAVLLGQKDYEIAWSRELDLIREDILKNGWNEEIQSFTQTYDNTDMDSSLLLMEQYGFIEPTDERFVKTVKRIKEELFHDGLMYRYKIHDDFGMPSSAFTICTFWLIRALYVIGEEDEAHRIFDQLLSYSNHLGLFSEDLDFKTKRMLGNFPQAYSHLAVIDTAILFAEEKKSVNFIKP